MVWANKGRIYRLVYRERTIGYMNIERLITVIVGIVGILASIDAGIQRYNRATKSKYAAERDFAHLQRNQEQLKQSIAVILEENDKMNDDVIKIRTQLETLIAIQRER